MSKLQRKKNIDYWEGEDLLEEKIQLSAWELAEMIDQKLNNKPRGAPSKVWKKEINDMIDEYNKAYGRAYSRI